MFSLQERSRIQYLCPELESKKRLHYLVKVPLVYGIVGLPQLDNGRGSLVFSTLHHPGAYMEFISKLGVNLGEYRSRVPK
jgi:hypothetical protein